MDSLDLTQLFCLSLSIMTLLVSFYFSATFNIKLNSNYDDNTMLMQFNWEYTCWSVDIQFICYSLKVVHESNQITLCTLRLKHKPLEETFTNATQTHCNATV